MIELLLGLFSGGSSTLLSLGGILIALVGVFMSGRISGAKREREHKRAKDADAYEKHLKDISDAAHAGSRVNGSDKLSDDPNNRDR